MSNFPPRRAEPKQAFDFTDASGRQRTLRADGDGVVWPKDDAEVAIADAFGLPQAQPAAIERARARRSSSKTRRQAKKPTGKVVVAETGEIDTRGPGAPADEPGVTDAPAEG